MQPGIVQPMQHLDPALWPDTAAIRHGHLTLGGCDSVQLAQTFGTPLYLLDHETLHATARRYTATLAAAYPAPGSVHYAGKALLNTALAQLVARAGLGLDCVSLGEIAVARRAGVSLDHVHLHGNAKPRREVEQALAWGVGRIMVDSLDELRQLAAIVQDRAQPQAIMLRVNPGVDVHTHAHIQTGQLDSKFGLPIATGMAEAAVQLALRSPNLQLVGLHAHLGSQIHELDRLALGVDRLLQFAAAMRERHGFALHELSPGGGLAVPYRSGDPAPTIEAYVQMLAAAVIDGCARSALPLPRLVIEPGRSLIARSIVALYEVISIKAIPNVRTFVAVDGGMGDNLRPALYEARYSVLRADAPLHENVAPVTVVGRYCESGDVLLRDVALPPLATGALLAIPMAGAYTLSMASNYNLVPRPALVLLDRGQARELQRRETLDDLVQRDAPLPEPEPRT